MYYEKPVGWADGLCLEGLLFSLVSKLTIRANKNACGHHNVGYRAVDLLTVNHCTESKLLEAKTQELLLSSIITRATSLANLKSAGICRLPSVAWTIERHV